MAAANDDTLKKKIDELNLYAWNVRVNDSPKAFELSSESVQLSKSINYTKGLAEGLRSLGFCYVRLSKNDEALPMLKEALSLFQSLDDLKGQAVVYEYLGIIKRNWGDLAGSLELLLKALVLSEQTAFLENISTNCYQVGVTYKHLGDFDRAIDYLYRSLMIAKEIGYVLMQGYAINVIGSVYFETCEYNQALDYYLQGLTIRQEAGDKWGEAGSLDNIGFTYLKLHNYEKAIDYCKRSLEITNSTSDKRGQANALLHLAEIYQQLNKIEQATKYCNDSLQIRKTTGDKRGEAETLLFLADLLKLQQANENHHILEYISAALKITEEIKAIDLSSKAQLCMHLFYKQNGDFENALKHLELHIHLEKEVHKNAVAQKVLNLEISHKAEETKKEAETIRIRNDELTKLNKEIEEQKQQLEDALNNLKNTQAQLIQSEKMASLGELTAGIAHEIQNPLNFVNNFSEINRELIEELKSQRSKLKSEELDELLDDIAANEEKINHHGKRADAIVKSMLQHSRKSAGAKEPADINLLCDEYLRLSYHGMRAKDKSFNADFKTIFDESIGKINVIPQDIGRVLLNLFNNAFYATNEKQQAKSATPKVEDSAYVPTVTVVTKNLNDAIEIIVTDNGNGIPQNIIDKIFQPFFTTKPTGEGTGLGLSLSYDIITKEHSGTIKVESKAGKGNPDNPGSGEGTEFIIQLPVT